MSAPLLFLLAAAAVDSASGTATRGPQLFEWDTVQALHWLRGSGLRILLIVGLALVARRVVYLLINRIRELADDGDQATMSQREKRATTLTGILKQATRLMIGGVATMMVLREFNIDIGPIIAGAGVLGLAVGFGAQSLVKDVIAGFFILLEAQFDVGDVVRGAGVQGVVEKMNLRFTQLRDLQGEVHFIPNGEFRVVSNLTRGWSRAVIDVGVDYATDVDRAVTALREIGTDLQTDPVFGLLLIDPIEVLGVENLAESAINIRVFLKAAPGRQHEVAREFRRRVKLGFDRLGIQIPFPQRTLRISYSDAGTSGPGRSSGVALADASEPAPGRLPRGSQEAPRGAVERESPPHGG